MIFSTSFSSMILMSELSIESKSILKIDPELLSDTSTQLTAWALIAKALPANNIDSRFI